MNLYEAIFARKSVRNYIQEELDGNLLNNLINFTKYVSVLENDCHVAFYIVENVEGKNKNMPKVSVKAPYYLLIASEIKEGYNVNVGYVAEQISLYLTTKGIGSCFLGISQKKLNQIARLDYPNVLLMAFGKPKEMIYRDLKKAKRYSLDKLCSIKAEISPNVKALLKAARFAPSALNRQPWRFVVYDNRIHIFLRNDKYLSGIFHSINEIDIGITLANLMIAAEELWLEASVNKQDNIAEKTVKNNEYITTVLIK